MRAFVGMLEWCWVAFALLLLGAISLGYNLVAALSLPILPPRVAHRAGRRGIMVAYRFYFGVLALAGLVRFDLRALDALRARGPLILAANHPSLLDAVLIVSRLPVVCLMKPAVLDNPFLGAGARLAGYLTSSPARRMLRTALDELARGEQVLVFPEGTRTVRGPVGAFKPGVAMLACRAQVPVQMVVIEHESRYLSKTWPIWRKPVLPIVVRIRLGRCVMPGDDPRAFAARLEHAFRIELGAPPEHLLEPDAVTVEVPPA